MSDTDSKTTDTEVAGLRDRIAELEKDNEKWKGLSRKHEDRAKENADAAKELAELKDTDTTAAQKAADKAAAAEQRASQAEAKAERLEVAIDKAPEGMSLAQVRKLSKRLTGASREELEADADELFADFKPDTGDGGGDAPGTGDDKDDTPATSGRRPTEKLTPGSAPATDADDGETDPDKLAAKVPRMY